MSRRGETTGRQETPLFLYHFFPRIGNSCFHAVFVSTISWDLGYGKIILINCVPGTFRDFNLELYSRIKSTLY